MLIQIIDYFIGDAFKENSDQLFKVRLLVGCLLSFTIGIVLVAPFYNLYPDLPDYTLPAYLTFCLPVVCFWAYILKRLKSGNAYGFSSHGFITSSVLMLFGSIAVTGGIEHSDIHPLLMIPVVVAFILTGKKGGLVWFIIIGGIYYSFLAIGYAGYEFINIIPETLQPRLKIIDWTYAFIIVSILIAIYDTLNHQLKLERDIERDRYIYMATHDAMTGLPNRKLFNESLAISISRADRHGYTLTVLMIDLDGFKPINDRLGHDAGDEVLMHVGKQLKNSVRKTDMVSRFGGDEFALLLEGVTNRTDLEALLHKLLRAISTPVTISDPQQEVIVSGSIGVATYPEHARESTELVRMADHSMYYAKNNEMHSKSYEPSVSDFLMDTVGTPKT